MKSNRMFIPALATAGLVLATCWPVAAQNLGGRLMRTVERAAEGEVRRAADRETRRVTRCALGDDRCAREARAAGHEVEIVDERGVGVAPVDTGGDHVLVRPYAGSHLRPSERQFAAYDEYERIVGREGDGIRTERLEGRLTRIVYNNPEGRSTLEIVRNYRQALEASGLQVEYECDGRSACATLRNGWASNGMRVGVYDDVRYFTGRMRNGDEDVYVSIAANPRRHFVHVLEMRAMQTGMVEVTADALAGDLERDGRVELEGIYFETGLATLTAESDPALEQVGVLMRQQPQLRLNIVGHTDNVGAAGMNVRLSQERADAVREALIAHHGVDAGRLSAQGVGSALPKASNDTEAGRASNRRVELVRQ